MAPEPLVALLTLGYCVIYVVGITQRWVRLLLTILFLVGFLILLPDAYKQTALETRLNVLSFTNHIEHLLQTGKLDEAIYKIRKFNRVISSNTLKKEKDDELLIDSIITGAE